MQLKPVKFKILDKQTCSRIHEQAFEILQKVGFEVHSHKMRKILAKVGAKVNDGNQIVTLPPELISDAIEATPSDFLISDFDGNTTPVGPGTISKTIKTATEGIRWLDYGTEHFRSPTLDDLRKALKVASALPVVNIISQCVAPMDIPIESQPKESLLAILSSTRKHVVFGIQNIGQAELITEALSVAKPDWDNKQLIGQFVTSPTSPLVLVEDVSDVLIHCLNHGMLASLAPCPMAGATSPMSIIGTALQQALENLFMVVTSYSIKPGAPVLWGGAGGAMDMKGGDLSYGGIERGLMMFANIDMAMYYGIPINTPAGAIDSCLTDVQAGIEKTWAYFARIISNSSAGATVGYIGNGKAISAEQMVIDNEILESIIRFAEGVETDHLLQAAKEIIEVGPGGNFMMTSATMDILQDGKEYYYPTVFNRAGTDAASMLEKAHEKVEKIVSEYKSPVPEKIVQELEKLLK